MRLLEALMAALQAPLEPRLPPPPSPSAASARSRRSSAAGAGPPAHLSAPLLSAFWVCGVVYFCRFATVLVATSFPLQLLQLGRWWFRFLAACSMEARLDPLVHGRLIVLILALAYSTAGGSVHAVPSGPPLSVEASWEVLRAPHSRTTALAAANDGTAQSCIFRTKESLCSISLPVLPSQVAQTFSPCRMTHHSALPQAAMAWGPVRNRGRSRRRCLGAAS